MNTCYTLQWPVLPVHSLSRARQSSVHVLRCWKASGLRRAQLIRRTVMQWLQPGRESRSCGKSACSKLRLLHSSRSVSCLPLLLHMLE